MQDNDLDFKIDINASTRKSQTNSIGNNINDSNQSKVLNNPNSGNNDNNIEVLKSSQGNQQNNKNKVLEFYKTASHPSVCFFTFIFKLLAFATFIIIAFFTDKKSAIYLAVILFGSVDFWITKNISGRMLVGLRWWNEVKKNGEEVWIFESKNEKKENTVDKTIFWGSLYINAIGWGVLFILELISLSISWCVVSLVMLIFGGTNLYGYFKCSKDQQGKLKTFGGKMIANAGKKATKEAVNNMINNK